MRRAHSVRLAANRVKLIAAPPPHYIWRSYRWIASSRLRLWLSLEFSLDDFPEDGLLGSRSPCPPLSWRGRHSCLEVAQTMPGCSRIFSGINLEVPRTRLMAASCMVGRKETGPRCWQGAPWYRLRISDGWARIWPAMSIQRVPHCH